MTCNLTGTGYLELKPIQVPGLKYRLHGSYSYLPGRYDYYTGRNMGDLIGHGYAQSTETQNWIMENILSYAKDIQNAGQPGDYSRYAIIRSAPSEPWTAQKIWSGMDIPGDHSID